MTMHVVLGDGLLPAKELQALLQDLSDKAAEADDPFWFLVQGKAEPTDTDAVLMRFLIDHDVYYEMITDGSESDIYTGHQERYVVKRLTPKVVSLMQERPEEGEEAHVLALFASDDPDADEDKWLNDVIQAVTDEGFVVLAMNDGMQEIKIINTDDEVAEEEEEEPVPAKTTAAKKAPAKKAAAAPAKKSESYTREELEEMDLDGLKDVAASLGIELPPRTRMATYIDRILGEGKDEEVEIITAEVEFPEDEGEPTVKFRDSVSAPAMLIVVYNGTVMSKALTDEEARAIITV